MGIICFVQTKHERKKTMSNAHVTIDFLDNSDEISRCTFDLPMITELNFPSMTAVDGKVPVLVTAVRLVSLCNPVKETLSQAPVVLAHTIPSSSYAQREMCLLIEMQDTVTFKKFHRTIPGVDWNAIGQLGTDNVNPLALEWIALVAAIEGIVVSPDGNPVNVLGGRRVGRNN
jgi:hypothetical protein